MKLLSVFILCVFSFSAFAEPLTCSTSEGIEYTCDDNVDMLQSILKTMEPQHSTVYSFSGRDRVLRHIVRYGRPGEEMSESFFQDYIYNLSGNFFHLVHFVRQDDGSYFVYLETDKNPSKVLRTDLKSVTSRMSYLGQSTDMKFNEDGYPSGTVTTSTDVRKLSSSKRSLEFSIEGSFHEHYNVVYSFPM